MGTKGNGDSVRKFLPESGYLEHHESSQTSDEEPRKKLNSFGEDELNRMVSRVRDYLQGASKAHSGQHESEQPRDAVYTVSDSDLKGLFYHILDTINQLDGNSARYSSPPVTSSRSPSIQSAQMLRPMRSAVSSPADPATTIGLWEASFTPASGLHDAELQERPPATFNTTKATIVSRNSVTEVTWPPGLDNKLRAAFETQLLPDENLGSKECPTSGPDEVEHGTKSQTKLLDASFGDNNSGQQAEQESGPPSRRPSVLGMLRNRSVAFSQVIGSFVNGSYRNADHRERRPSSVPRMRAILDRLEPSRPKQDPMVFEAFTGAQPILPTDKYAARRPSPHDTTCSEDGRQHTCVQHDTRPA